MIGMRECLLCMFENEGKWIIDEIGFMFRYSEGKLWRTGKNLNTMCVTTDIKKLNEGNWKIYEGIKNYAK